MTYVEQSGYQKEVLPPPMDNARCHCAETRSRLVSRVKTLNKVMTTSRVKAVGVGNQRRIDINDFYAWSLWPVATLIKVALLL